MGGLAPRICEVHLEDAFEDGGFVAMCTALERNDGRERQQRIDTTTVGCIVYCRSFGRLQEWYSRYKGVLVYQHIPVPARSRESPHARILIGCGVDDSQDEDLFRDHN